jgi:hypothetical protein
MIYKCKYFGIKCQNEESVESKNGIEVRKQLISKGWNVSDRVYSNWICPDCTKAINKVGKQSQKEQQCS